jgi:hypothetical protein
MTIGQATAAAPARRNAIAEIDVEISAYEAIPENIETQHRGKWALIHAGELIGVYDSFEVAAEEAVRHFGRGPYLIRQIGASPVTLPASVMCPRAYGRNPVRF